MHQRLTAHQSGQMVQGASWLPGDGRLEKPPTMRVRLIVVILRQNNKIKPETERIGLLERLLSQNS